MGKVIFDISMSLDGFITAALTSPRSRSSGLVWQGQDSNLCRQCRRFYKSQRRLPLAYPSLPTWSRPSPVTCTDGLVSAPTVT